MILNAVIEPWCQYSILRKTASISSITECEPRPVLVIEISTGLILSVKSARVLGASDGLVLKVSSLLICGLKWV